MIDLHLRAPDEAALAAALPMFRATIDEPGVEAWVTGSACHALDLGIAVVKTPAVLAEDGSLATAAVLAAGYHANLRLSERHPDLDAILAAGAPFRVEPAEPQRVFAWP